MSLSVWSKQNKTLQESLKSIRKESGLTQLELATLLQRPQSYVSKYESGEKRLDLLEIREISIQCGFDLKKLIDTFEKNMSKI